MACGILEKQQIAKVRRKNFSIGNVKLEMPMLVIYTNGGVACMAALSMCEALKEAWDWK